MFSRIMVICVGNICRSPMGEAILAARVKQRGIVVESAGIGALTGHPADPLAVELLAERGLDISHHRARQLSEEMARQADLILVMEQWHQKEIERMLPMCRGRVHLFGKWGNFIVPDPFRQPRRAFERALTLIEQGAAEWEAKL